MSIDATGHQSWGCAWRHAVRHSLPALLMLVSLSTIVHSLHFDFGLAHQLMRQVAWGFHELGSLQATAPTSGTQAPRIVVFEIQPVFAQALESQQPRTVELMMRLGGDRPLDRGKVAAMLLALAKDLDQRTPKEGRPRILALDFDLAPLGNPDAAPDIVAGRSGDTSPGSGVCLPGTTAELTRTEKKESDEMIEALDALRGQFASVIAVALPRSSCRERITRREFLKSARCTGLAAGATPPADPKRGDLYIASARLANDARGGVSQYLGFRDETRRESVEAGLIVPDEFPSLGTLARLAADRSAENTDRRARILESQCLAATREDDPLLIEEQIPVSKAPAVNGVDDWYVPTYIDWSTLSSGRATVAPLFMEAVKGAGGNYVIDVESLLAFSAPVVMIAVDGGPNSDKHRTPVFPGPISGAKIHAAITSPVKLVDAGLLRAFAADIVAGLVFLGIWAVLEQKLARGNFQGYRNPSGSRPRRRRTRMARRMLWLLWLIAAPWLLFHAVAHGFSISAEQLAEVAWVVKMLGLALVIICLGIPFVVAVAGDGWYFGQQGAGLGRMPWLQAVSRRFLPLGVALFVAVLALAASFISLMRLAGGHYYDVSLVMIGLLVHSYVEAAHRSGDEHPVTLRAALGVVRRGPGPRTWRRWLDSSLCAAVWLLVPGCALYMLIRAAWALIAFDPFRFH